MQRNESLHQLAFELGGTDGGSYLLTAEDLDAIIEMATKPSPPETGLTGAPVPNTEIQAEIDQLKGLLHLARSAIGDYKWGRLTKDIDLLADGSWVPSELLMRASAILGSQGCTAWDEIASDLRALLSGPGNLHKPRAPSTDSVSGLHAHAALATFTNKMIDIAFAGGDAGGGHIQELATELGLLIPQVRQSRCENESCGCAADADFPTTCFVRSKTLLGSLRPGQDYFGALPDNLESHRSAWLGALSRLHELEPSVAVGEADDKSYWMHELMAMQDMYADLDRLKGIAAASP